jgi:protein-tyrosine phosphatase
VLDLHSHVLPGIDDGPPDVKGSLKLAADAAADGIRVLAATPHLREDHPCVVPGELRERCEVFNAELEREGIDLEVIPGGELDLLWARDASEEELRLVSYGQLGGTLLVETPYGPLPETFEALLFGLALKGFQLMLAHPERNPSFQGNPDRLAELVRRGTLVQVTAASLVRSPRESGTAALARSLVSRGLAHVIASDAHGPAARDRASLSAGAAAAAAIVGEARARWLVEDSPAAIVRGEKPPQQPPAEAPPKRRLLGRLGL